MGDSGEGSGKTALLQALKKSIFDIRVGMVLCCIIATVLLSIGATVLKPLGIVPKGIDIMLKMSEIYTQTLGEWIFPVFIVTLFAAFWGSYLVAMDGMKRIFGDLTSKIFKVDEEKAKKAATG